MISDEQLRQDQGNFQVDGKVPREHREKVYAGIYGAHWINHVPHPHLQCIFRARPATTTQSDSTVHTHTDTDTHALHKRGTEGHLPPDHGPTRTSRLDFAGSCSVGRPTGAVASDALIQANHLPNLLLMTELPDHFPFPQPQPASQYSNEKKKKLNKLRGAVGGRKPSWAFNLGTVRRVGDSFRTAMTFYESSS